MQSGPHGAASQAEKGCARSLITLWLSATYVASRRVVPQSLRLLIHFHGDTHF